VKRLEARFALAGAFALSLFAGFTFLAFTNWSAQQQALNKIEISVQILQSSNELFKPRESPQAKEKLEKLLPELQPQFRAEAIQRLLTKKERSQLLLVLDSESRFQKYAMQIASARGQRSAQFVAVSALCLTLLWVVLLAMNRRWVFGPLARLNQRILDFLNNRYSYEFETPAKTELGEIESTFNLMAQKVIDQIQALKRLDQAKSDFLSIASHELRTPLTSIKGSLSLMEAGVTGTISDQAKTLMGIALTETDRLIRLINDLLDLAKIEAGHFSLEMKWHNPNLLLEKTCQSLTGFAKAADVSLNAECETNLEGYLDFDRTQQVLTNPCSNAIKFSPKGGQVVIRVFIDTDRQLRFEVQDQGPGIAPQDQQLIFQKFTQSTSPDNPLVKGTGLGLAIAKGLVEEQGGTISLRSQPGHGSAFYFCLPKWRLAQNHNARTAS